MDEEIQKMRTVKNNCLCNFHGKGMGKWTEVTAIHVIDPGRTSYKSLYREFSLQSYHSVALRVDAGYNEAAREQF